MIMQYYGYINTRQKIVPVTIGDKKCFKNGTLYYSTQLFDKKAYE